MMVCSYIAPTNPGDDCANVSHDTLMIMSENVSLFRLLLVVNV
jgi:hypothetical protein